MSVQETRDVRELLAAVLDGADSPEEWLEARIALLAAQGMSGEEISGIAGVPAPTTPDPSDPAVRRC